MEGKNDEPDLEKSRQTKSKPERRKLRIWHMCALVVFLKVYAEGWNYILGYIHHHYGIDFGYSSGLRPQQLPPVYYNPELVWDSVGNKIRCSELYLKERLS